MINNICVQNFQSHKKTQIDLIPNGVNVIVGASDQGKSAILRALLWAVNNRPLGTDDIVSHWARDAKGKIDGEMSVAIMTDKGTCTRRRTAGDNEYILLFSNGKGSTYKAINKDIPDDVVNFFQLTDVNIQQQHDAPFLLSASSSDVAKYFNKIVRLDIIDKVLSNAESARRADNKAIKDLEKEIELLKGQIEEYNWVEAAQELAEKLEQVEQRIKIYIDDSDILNGTIDKYKDIKENLADMPDTITASSLIEKIEKIVIDYDGYINLNGDIASYKELNRDRKLYAMIGLGKDFINDIEGLDREISISKQDVDVLAGQVKSYRESKESADLGFDKERTFELIKEFETIRPDYNGLRNLSVMLNEYDMLKRSKDDCRVKIAAWRKELPAVCPECGAPIEECGE